MPRVSAIAFALATSFGAVVVCAETYSVASNQLEPTKVYWGSSARFSKPAEVDFQQVFEATPEYQEIRKKKVERGTGKYWLLASQGSDHAVKAIAQVAKEAHYDLVAAEGCLAGLKPPIPADDITDLVVETITGKTKKPDSKGKPDTNSRESQTESENESTQSENEKTAAKRPGQSEDTKTVEQTENKQGTGK